MNREREVDLQKYHGYVIFGMRGGGKSVLGEVIAERALRRGCLVFDSYSAGYDLESAFWCVPGEKGIRYPVILVHPEYASIEVPQSYKKWVTPMCDKVGVGAIYREALKSSPPKVVVFLNILYEDDHMLTTLGDFYKDTPQIAMEVDNDFCVLIREASQLVSANMNIFENAKLVKRSMVKFLNVARHSRTHFVLDLQLFGDLFRSVREICDRVMVKKATFRMFPESLRWFPQSLFYMHRSAYLHGDYEEYSRRVPLPPKLEPHQYYCIYPDDEYSLNTNPMPNFHHRRERDVFTKLTGVKIEVDDEGRIDEQASSKEKLWKARTAQLVDYLCNTNFMQQREVGELLGVDRSTISRLLNYK